MVDDFKPVPKGRGSHINPPNRFEAKHSEPDFEHLEHDEEYLEQLGHPATEYLPDNSQSLVSENDSPDVPFRYSVNPYRGCAHGCSYCYARPTHEYLGMNAGLDFETKVFVKHRAPELFREWLARDAWRPESITFSGVTDCYQPAEREFRLTRGCLEVALEARQPVFIITKNALVTRDLDLLEELSKWNAVGVALSITSLDPELRRAMEPRTSIPAARLRAIRELSAAGVPAHVMVAPIIPGLNDSEIPAILEAAKEAGAVSAGFTLLRLPWTVKPVFLEWVRRAYPLQAGKIESLIRSTRKGNLNDSDFRSRMRGEGQIAEQIKSTFQVFKRRFGLDAKRPPLETCHFRAPRTSSGQLRLF